MKRWLFLIIQLMIIFSFSGIYAIHIDEPATGLSFDLPSSWEMTRLSNGIDARNAGNTMEMALRLSPVQQDWKAVEEYIKTVNLSNLGTNIQYQKTYGITLNDVYVIAREYNFTDNRGRKLRGALAVMRTLQGYSYINATSKVDVDAGVMADLLNFAQTVKQYRITVKHPSARVSLAIPFHWQHEWLTNTQEEVLKISISNKNFFLYLGYVPNIVSRQKALEWVREAPFLFRPETNMVWSESRELQIDTIPVLVQNAEVRKKALTAEEKRYLFQVSLTNPEAITVYDENWVAENTILYTGRGLAFKYLVYNKLDCRREWTVIRKLNNYLELIE